jgi:hypothetical protein
MIVQVRHSANTGNSPLLLANGELALNAVDQLLYFRRSNGTVGILANGAAILTFSTAQISSNLNQIPANTSVYRVTFNSNDLLIGATHVLGNSRVTVLSNGWYRMVATGQVFRTAGGANLNYADFWFRKNGVDIPQSTARASLKNAATFDHMINENVLRLVANDYIELVQAVFDATVGMGLTVPTTLAGGPSIPSIKLNITKMAN